jgi:hypothetical protein
MYVVSGHEGGHFGAQSVTNRRSLWRNRELVYWLRAVPRPARRRVLCLRLYQVSQGSILRNITCY